ncbi:hypothetical protein [cf. Phormidesmis sp. LEGE 11477]|uniref:hypothetical protein n=1 Tax=cf. Phormidesmis sp. LEGE 11477 TaxID=1828680 RepID=UPI00187EF3BA|nr:hypothetical protein [cf. Phormidesmis sp. LEGE 11477]MBE9063124.1 hypothetical protein [cf. Phormidesmis sp. LEGE 11477]
MRVLRWLCLGCLLLLTSGVTGCQALAQVPPDKAVRLAIAQQLSQTQQAIAQDLGLLQGSEDESKANFKLEKVTVNSREKVTDLESAQRHNIQDVYRVRGSFEAKLLHPIGQPPPTRSPFELYLGTNPTEADGLETWFVLNSD